MKKFKKSLGPDFIESSELGPQYMKNSFEPKCDLCQLRSKSNKNGEKEQLLSCKDCNTRGFNFSINSWINNNKSILKPIPVVWTTAKSWLSARDAAPGSAWNARRVIFATTLKTE